jgi:succinate dehydrogenase/fumarate reductase flavoprotein subunit
MVKIAYERNIDGYDQKIDVVVIGLGGAGACSAIAAADSGADVLILEKQPSDGYYSNTRMSGGAFHSPKPSGDKESLKEYALAMFSGQNLPWKLEGELPDDIALGLAEKWAEYAPQNLSWMRSLDPEFDVAIPEERGAAFPQFPGADESRYRVVISTYSGELENRYRSQVDDAKAMKESGEAFHACLFHGITDREIPIHWGTPASSLIINEEGDAVGVVAEKNGSKTYYKSGATVLASGGYEYNEELRHNFLEGPGVAGWSFYGSPANTGDGILMGMHAGVGLSKVSNAASRIITKIPVEKNGLEIGLRTPVVGRPHAIVVDDFGERYVAERKITQDPSRYFFYKEAVKFDIENLIYPRVPSWLIFDETLRVKRPVVGLREVEYHGLFSWGEKNEDAIEEGWILKAQTVEGLASKINEHEHSRGAMDEEDLANSVLRYNRFCESETDEDFNSKPANMGRVDNPPYYALPLYPGGPNTKGGIKSDAERRALDWEGNPISNLYTAGEISSAFKFVYQGGGNLAECIVFGRIAGKNAARQAIHR